MSSGDGNIMKEHSPCWRQMSSCSSPHSTWWWWSQSKTFLIFVVTSTVCLYPSRISASPSTLTSTEPDTMWRIIRSKTSIVSRRNLGPKLTIRWHGGPAVTADAPRVHITFLQPDSTKKTVEAIVGESLLQTAHRNDIELEGACEGVCACSTCHLIMPMDLYRKLDEPSEDEEDMLDMAFGLTETSRLGCQILVTQDMEGVELEMPKATRNFYVDGHIPVPH